MPDVARARRGLLVYFVAVVVASGVCEGCSSGPATGSTGTRCSSESSPSSFVQDRLREANVLKLFFDVDPDSISAWRERHLLDVVRDPEEVGWRAVLVGSERVAVPGEGLCSAP